LLAAKINIPFNTNLSLINEQLIKLFHELFIKQLFIDYKKDNKIITITIHDPELLLGLAELIKPITGKINIPKNEKNEFLIQQLKKQFKLHKEELNLKIR
jgi:hypothetical protein